MKTLTKKILTVCLTLAMACALAIPAFADFDNGYNGYHIRNESIGGNNYLNMEGSGGPYNSRNVTVYSRTGDATRFGLLLTAATAKKFTTAKRIVQAMLTLSTSTALITTAMFIVTFPAITTIPSFLTLGI